MAQLNKAERDRLWKKYGAEDKLPRGRPLRCNRHTLNALEGKPYAEFLPFGDLHYGHPQFNDELTDEVLCYALQHKLYLLGMGDYLEMSCKTSPGSSVFYQKPPDDQIDWLTRVLKPFAMEGLCLGLHNGNHENRSRKDTGLDTIRILCNHHDFRYLGDAIWNYFSVGDQHYTVYSLHGTSSAKFEHTKLKVATDIAAFFSAELVLHAHLHSIVKGNRITYDVDRRLKKTRRVVQKICLTGSFLNYEGSYAQGMGLPPGIMGCPKIRLWKDRHHIEIIDDWCLDFL